MERKKFRFDLNKNNIINKKKRAKTPLLKKKSNSNILNHDIKDKKNNNINNNKIQENSPKTIDYEQLMEKYGNIIEDNYNKILKKNRNEIKKNNIPLINKTPLKKSPDINNFFVHKNGILEKHDIIQEEEKNNINNNNKLITKAKNIMRNQKQNIKILSMKTLTKKNNSFSNINYSNNTNNIKINPIYNKGKIKSKNNSEFENLKKQITILKKENEKLRANTISQNYYLDSNNINNNSFLLDKFLLLLNLCRKYAKKFNKIYPLLEIEFTSKNINTDIFEELKNTIKQYNKMIFSEKINNLFKINFKEQNILNPLDISNFEPKSMVINIDNKYKNIIMKLREENSELKKKVEKINSLNKKIEDITEENNNLKKIINEINEKDNKLEYQNNIIENLKCQIETLNNSNKFKESKIANLQNILEKNRLTQNLFSSNSISDQNTKNSKDKIDNNKSKLLFNNNEINNIKNINRYDNNIISKITISSYNENLNSNNNSSIFNDNINNENDENVNVTPNDKIVKKDNNIFEKKVEREFFHKNEKIGLNNEIEELDKEIMNIKSKLKEIIKKS